ncbi:MAG TPA: FAD-linked oxidase C-terminal domain-containing protein [Candidatus Angelobacter sp.]|jgi:glycolate oxidase|nr:FAD-linked oxidase C-terminal domain-containing protein [Candidatus Angelobacter sp.]
MDPSILKQLKKIAGNDAVLDRPEELMLYEYDAGVDKCRPGAVVFPLKTEQVSQIMRVASQNTIPVVPRGAGTGLSGGAIARKEAIVLSLARMNKILEIDVANQRAVVQPGVVNLEVSNATSKYGYYYAPDPSSQKACTIGGNVAENSGGPHTLALGVTVNHVTGLEAVLPDGRVVRFGGKAQDSTGLDLTGFFVGSEGTMGVVTEITVKLTRLPEHVTTLLAIYNTVEDAANTVVAITQSGITPAALEMLDGWMVRCVEANVHAGYPEDAAAVLLIELEGMREMVEEQAEAVSAVCMQQKAREVRRARDEKQRQLLWLGRKTAFGAVGRVSPSYYTQDGVIPRTKVPYTLAEIERISKKYELIIGNVFHAGDGNLHPLILFDARDPKQKENCKLAAKEIMACCLNFGGSITGEHGVGMEKRNLMTAMFTEDDLEVMIRLRNAYNPANILNPQKVIPDLRYCREITGPLPKAKVEPAPGVPV